MTSELATSYNAAGFSKRLGWGDTPALLVIDAVQAYTDPASPLYLETAAAASSAMAQLLAVARSSGHPIAYSTVAYLPDLSDAGHFAGKVPALRVFAGDSPLRRWPACLQPLSPDWIVTKQYASAFFGTSLASWLAVRRVDTTVICGFSTSGCVRATALDALQSGFRPMVVREAVADRDTGPHEANLFDLEAKYADVVSLEEAVRHLGGEA